MSSPRASNPEPCLLTSLSRKGSSTVGASEKVTRSEDCDSGTVALAKMKISATTVAGEVGLSSERGGQSKMLDVGAVRKTEASPSGKKATSPWLSLLCFVCLSVQNASIVLLTRWLKINRPHLVGPSEDTLIVVGGELVKFATSLAVVAAQVILGDGLSDSSNAEKKTDGDVVNEISTEQSSSRESLGLGWRRRYHRLVGRELFNLREFAHMAVPAVIYVVQNKLIFLSYGKLPSPIFQVTYQSKILTAALMARLLLKQILTRRKWIALVLLMTGITIVQVDGHAFIQSLSEKDRSSVDYGLGLAAAFAAVMCSGLGGVYFEMVLKGSQVNLWVRNVHLALVSVGVGMVSDAVHDMISPRRASAATSIQRAPRLTLDLSGMSLVDKGISEAADFFARLASADALVWYVILLHCYGGLLVSLLIKYTDTIVKAFAAAVAILVASLASLVLFPDFQLSSSFMVGFSLVAYSIYMYSN
ncbi:unnamed protein product [Amoebophrya sp. A25]|nr:unnamed protein product [Amoebophrya sp. A25]|eukprot:GSA25T00001204001.1